jgi:hypothetical protein
MLKLKILATGHKITISSNDSERILCRVDPTGSFIRNDVSGKVSGMINSYHLRTSDTEFRIRLVDSYTDFLEDFLIKNYVYDLSDENKKLDWIAPENSLGWGVINYIDLHDESNSPALCIALYLNQAHKDSDFILKQLYSSLQSSRPITFTTDDPAIVASHVSYYQPTEFDFLEKNKPIWFKQFSFQFN